MKYEKQMQNATKSFKNIICMHIPHYAPNFDFQMSGGGKKEKHCFENCGMYLSMALISNVEENFPNLNSQTSPNCKHTFSLLYQNLKKGRKSPRMNKVMLLQSNILMEYNSICPKCVKWHSTGFMIRCLFWFWLC